MRIVLDTHMLLWWLSDDQRLARKAKEYVKNPRNSILISSASIWETAIKRALGRIDIELSDLVEAVVTSNFKALDISMQHAIAVAELPQHHRDPFDRILIAQCIVEGAYLLTNDTSLKKYGKSVIVV